MGYRGSERSTRRAVAEVKEAGGRAGAGATGRGCPSRGCGCSGTGATGRGSGGGRRSCSRVGGLVPGPGGHPLRDKQMPSLTRRWIWRCAGRRRADICADGQRADRDDRACCRDPRAPSPDGRVRAGITAARWRRACRSIPNPKAGSRHGEDRQGDLVPRDANLLPAYGSFAGLEEACREFCDRVNGRVHRETAAVPADRWPRAGELHPLPDEPYALALGEERLVGDDQTIRFGSVRYSTPPGHAGTPGVWCRGRRGGTGDHRPHRPGRCFDHPQRPSVPGQPVHLRRALPGPSRAGTGRASPGHGQGPRLRPRSWRSGTRRSGGWPRPLRPAPPADPLQNGPGRPSWPPVLARTGSTLPGGWRQSRAGSPTRTRPRSLTTWPPSGGSARS